MAIPTDELLQEDFNFPVQGYDIEQIRQSIANRIPLLGSQRGVYGLGIGSGGTNLAGGYIPSYNVATDPTYSSGFQYAQQIAGGMPFEQVVAPGMSFSPEQPMGYTQADLNVVNLPRDVAPVFPTPPATTGEVFEPTQPTMPYAPPGTLMPTIFGFQAPQFPPIDLSQLPEIDLSQITIPESVKSSLGELLGIPKIDTSQFVSREDISGLRSDMLGSLPQMQMPDVSQFVNQQDINRAISGIPQISLSDIEARLAALESTPSIGVPKLPRPTGLFA